MKRWAVNPDKLNTLASFLDKIVSLIMPSLTNYPFLESSWEIELERATRFIILIQKRIFQKFN